jgi:hypothetical protein
MGLNELIRAYGTDRSGRAANDFYETRDCDTRALLLAEQFEGSIWEPAAGRGAIARVLDDFYEGRNYVSASDKFRYPDPVFGPIRELDFLSPTGAHEGMCDNVITNPPFSHAQEFAERALFVARRKVALLLRLNFLEGRRRRPFFQQHPPTRVLIFSNRIGFVKNGIRHDAGMMPHMWCCWNKDYCEGDTRIAWIESAREEA